MHADELRKLAEELRQTADENEHARMENAAHILLAAKGLLAMSQKKKGWYDTRL